MSCRSADAGRWFARARFTMSTWCGGGPSATRTFPTGVTDALFLPGTFPDMGHSASPCQCPCRPQRLHVVRAFISAMASPGRRTAPRPCSLFFSKWPSG